MKTLKTYLPAIFFIVFIFSLPAFCELPKFWTDPKQFSLGQASSMDADACSFENKIYVVWADNRTGNSEIFFRSSDDTGQTWSREERITLTFNESSQPAIACDARKVQVVWREKSENISQIYYKKWDGKSWTNDILLSEDQKNAKRPDIAITTIMPDSYLYVVWENTNEQGKSSAYLTRSINNGETFSETQTLADGKWETKEPAVWCGARNAYITWIDKREGFWSVFFRRLGENQNSSEIKLSSIFNCSSPSIGGIEPNVYVTWQCLEELSVYRNIYASYSKNHGNEWSKASRVTYGEAESILPKVIVSRTTSSDINPSAWFFWQDGRNGDWEIFYSTMIDGKISDAESLISSDNPLIMPDAITTSGQIHLFWTNIVSDLESNLFYVRRDTVPPDRPGVPSHFDLTANLGYDDDKKITFMWKSPNATDIAKYNIYASTDDGEFVFVGDTAKTFYDLAGESNKTYRIYVSAVDEVGNISLPSEISQKVICDADPPNLMIHSPRSYSTIMGEVPIIISVNDNNLLESNVEYGMSVFPSTWLNLAGPFKMELDRERIMLWDTSNLKGRYVLRVTASDKAGNESKSEAIVDIDQPKPISISLGDFSQITLPDLNWDYVSPSWSPNSDRIVYCSDEGGTEDLWLMSPDGTNRTRLTRDAAIERKPAWSPAGDMIVYQSMIANPQPSKEEEWKLWVINSNGSNPKQITFGEGSHTNPSWSPDGSAIVFDTNIDGDSEIWLITNINRVLSGEQPQARKLTNNRWDDKNPKWSPDGSTIIYQSNGKGSWDIYEMEADGGNPKPLIDTIYDEVEPVWSPDKKWIMFSTNENGGHYEIKAINWLSKSEQVFLSAPNIDAHNPSWSPYMDMIVYESNGALYTTTLSNPLKNLDGYISFPKGGDILSGYVDIKGIANGTNFAYYAIQYFDPKTNKYYTIGGNSTAQVFNDGFLGKWDINELEGQYRLILTVRGINGEYIEDSAWVIISNRLPFIVIDEPEDNLKTKNSIIDFKGRAEPYATVTIDGNLIKLNKDGSFSRKVQLIEGLNKININVCNGLDQNNEFTIERKVILDTVPPILNIESPIDFQVTNVPYITIKGKVEEKAEINVLSSRVWTDGNGNFQKRISLKEGDNIITVVASDSLGQYTSIQRRVIFKRDTEIVSDPNVPAIVDVFPDNNAVYTGRSLKISAKLIDDIGIDPFSIRLWFDDKEIDSKDYELDIGLLKSEQIISIDQYPVINLAYKPIYPISDGKHSFKIYLEDTSGNIAESAFNFSIDTITPEAFISAFLSDKSDKINIVVSVNKPLNEINSIAVVPSFGMGYTLSNLAKKDDHYEVSLNIAPSQKSFQISFSAKTYLGSKIESSGFLAWDIIRSGEQINIGSDNSAGFISDPVNIRNGRLTVTLRSQDGLDSDILSIYKNDFEFRRLKPVGLIYILSTTPEPGEGMIKGILNLPKSSTDSNNLVMFRWDDSQMRWQALDRLNLSDNFISSKIDDIGTYALFSDIEPPIISNISPIDTSEVPLDRFLVEATIIDNGSGVAKIDVIVDGKQVSYEYDSANGKLIYYPSELDWGFHKMQIIATDRAGNIAEIFTSFQTREVFQFIKIKAYPNPARDNVNIEFKLTKSAEVNLKIYTINGELVFDTMKNNIAQGIFQWKCRNNSGNKAASGVYIYVLEAKIFETKIHKQGKIALIK